MNIGCELDSLRVGETEHLVVIENSVHVFDPYSIHRPIADQPLVVCFLTLQEIPKHVQQLQKLNNLRNTFSVYAIVFSIHPQRWWLLSQTCSHLFFMKKYYIFQVVPIAKTLAMNSRFLLFSDLKSRSLFLKHSGGVQDVIHYFFLQIKQIRTMGCVFILRDPHLHSSPQAKRQNSVMPLKGLQVHLSVQLADSEALRVHCEHVYRLVRGIWYF